MFREKKNNYAVKITAWICLITFMSGIFYSGPGMMLSAQGVSKKFSSNNLSQSSGGILEYNGFSAEKEVGGSNGSKDAEVEDTLVVGLKETARVAVRRDALLKKTKIRGRTLEKSEVPAMKQGMVNATSGETPRVEAYEFTPHGLKFKKPVKIYLPYDPRYIPKDMGEESLYTYFYDEQSKQWVRLERVGVDKQNHFVISLTTHFTKMVNATLKLPESPQALSYNPNSLKDIKAADPSAGITMIEPPKGGAFGTNNLNYPIEVPPGRAGMQPQLAIAYNSGGSNGWLGVGWDLSIPSITHDTKFGVPKYDGNDTYLLNGQELVPAGTNGNIHRYVMRVEGSFQQILRYGNSADNYTWEVTDKNGNRTFYGHSPDSQVQSNRPINGIKPIFQWNQSESVDLNNNCLKYEYANDSYPEPGKIKGVDVTLKTITYTGVYDGTACNIGNAKYSVNFETDISRPDKVSNARSKFKTIVSKRLNAIDVKFVKETVRRYELTYDISNSAHKSVLTKLAVKDANKADFYHYDFAYEDMPKDSAGRYNAFSGVTEYGGGIGYTQIYGVQSKLLADLNQLINPAAAGLSYSESYSLGGGLDLGLEIKAEDVAGVDLSGNVNATSGGSLSRYLLMDLNGDNLPDQVMKNDYLDNNFKYAKHTGNGFSSVNAFQSQNVATVSQNPFEELIHNLHRTFDQLQPIVTILQAVVGILNMIPTWIIPGIGSMISQVVSAVNTAVQAIGAVFTVVAVMDNLPLSGLREYATVDNNNSFSFGGGVNVKVASVPASFGAGGTLSFTDSRITFQDINGDGFTDQLVLDDSGLVRYKINDGSKIIEGNSLESPGVTASLLPEDQVNEIKARFFHTEASRRWTAPKNGVILINGKVKKLKAEGKDGVRVRVNHEQITLVEETKKDQNGNTIKDGNGAPVKVKIKHMTMVTPLPLWEETIGAKDTQYHGHSIEVRVKAGQSIAFRVHSIEDTKGDTIEWAPEIQYISRDNARGAGDYACDPLIDKRCVLRGKQYILDRENFYSADQEYHVKGTPYIDVKKNDPAFDKKYSDYDTYDPDTGYYRVYRGWNYEEWNAVKNEFVMDMSPDLTEMKYHGAAGEDTFITKYQMNPSRVGGSAATSSLSASTGGGGGMPSMFIRKSVNTSTSFNVSVLGIGGSYSSGHTETKIDWADMNGDRYPDMLLSSAGGLAVAFNKGGKGFTGFIPYVNGEGIRISKDTSLAINAGSDGLEKVISSTGKLLKVKTSDEGVAKAGPGIGLNGGLTLGLSQSSSNLMDINGDGLPDMVSKIGGTLKYRLNYGDSFSEYENVEAGTIALSGLSSFLNVSTELAALSTQAGITVDTGDSLNFGTSFSGYFSVSPSSINGGDTTNDKSIKPRTGVNSSKTESKSFFELMDVNGDGLADIVVKENGQNLKVKLNYGTSFADNFIDWNVPGWSGHYTGPDILNYSVSNSTNASGGIEIPIPIPLPIYPPALRLVVTPKLNASTSFSETSLSMQDINGDGLVDRLYKGSDPSGNTLYAQLNQSGRVNLLKEVKGPLGMSMTFDYKRTTNTYNNTGNTVQNPNSQYVLTEVVVKNTHSTKTTCADASNCVEEDKTTFEYENGQYDRHERTAYGFSSVKETLPDGTSMRTDFLNGYDKEHSIDGNINLSNAYYTKGLAFKKESYRKDGSMYHREITAYKLFQAGSTTGSTVAIFPAAAQQEFDYLERNGQKTNFVSYTYDSFGNVLSEIDEGDDNDNQDTTHLLIEYATDHPRYIVGKPTSVAVFDNGQNLLRKRQAVYDATGNLKEFNAYSDSGSLSKSTLDYDQYGNIIKLTGPNGYTLNYVYETVTSSQVAQVSDSFNYSSYSKDFDYRFGVAGKTIDTNGNSIEYEYDSRGRMSKVWGPYLSRSDAPSLEMKYYPSDPVPKAWTKNREDHESARTIDTVIFIDSLKRVIQTMKTSEVYKTAGTVIGKTVTGHVLFDDMGRVISQSQPVFEGGLIGENTSYVNTPLLNETKFVYDDQGRTTKVTTPDNSITTTEYSIENSWMKTQVVDPEGRKKDSYADIYSKIREIREYNKGQAIKTTYEYSAVGEILKVKDAAGNVTRIDYDMLGRRLMIDNPDNGKTRFKYDAAGNLIEKITARLAAKQKSIKYEYEFNRLVKIDNPGKEKDVLYAYGNTGAPYNRAGRIVTIDDESGKTELFYGKLGEVVETDKTIREREERKEHEKNEDREDHKKAEKQQREYVEKLEIREKQEHLRQREHHKEHEKKYVTKQTWDSFGRMKQLTYPDGEVLTYTYDAGGLLQKATGKKGTQTFEYLKMLAYDEFGQRVYMDFGNHTETRYEYDHLTRRLSSLEMKAPAHEGGVKLLQSLSYKYDRVGNVLSITDGAVNPVKQEFGYDDLYRLISAHGTYERKAREKHADHYGETTGKSRNHEGRGEAGDHEDERKFHEYAQTFSYDNIHNMTQKTSMQRVREEENSHSHFVYSKENNYAYDYAYNGSKPHAVSSLHVTLRPEKEHQEHRGDRDRDHKDQRDFGRSHNDPHEYVINFNYDESGNLIDRDMEKEDEDEHGKERGNSEHKRYLRWDSADRLKAVFEHEDEGKDDRNKDNDRGRDHEKLTRFTYNANGERVIKHGEKGETIYVNQFFEIRDDEAVFKHVFAGNTRIATKMVEDEEHRKEKQMGGESRKVLPTNGQQGQGNTQSNSLNPNGGLNINGSTPNNTTQPIDNTSPKAKPGNDSGNSDGNNRDGSKNPDSHGEKDKKDNKDDKKSGDRNKDKKDKDRKDKKDKENNKDKNKNSNNGNHGEKRQNEGKRGENGQDNGNPGSSSESGSDANAQGQTDTTEQESTQPTQPAGVTIGDTNQGQKNQEGKANNGRHEGHECGHEDDRGYRGHDDEACVYYYHGDHLGSSNYITDAKGRVFEHVLYLPYGETWIDEGHETSLLGYKFTGKELDEETGLYYFGARYYDPQFSNWISTDPAFMEYLPLDAQLFFPDQAFNANSLKGAGGIYNSKNLNTYHYAGLRPIKLLDKDGRVTEIGPIDGYPEDGKFAWRKSNDAIFINAANEFNTSKGYKPGDDGYISAKLIKAWAMVESGGEGDKKAFLSDPFQVNNPGDWTDKKKDFGLTKGQTMTPAKSSKAALLWLDYKGWLYDAKGNKTKYNGLKRQFRDYNGNTKKYDWHKGIEHRDWYSDKILKLGGEEKPKSSTIDVLKVCDTCG